MPTAKPAGLEPKTVRNVHVMLHAALANAVGWRYVFDNVADHVNPPKVRRRKPSVWTPAQMRTFLTFVRVDRFYALYLLAAMTGMRRSELCGLRWPAVDLDAETVSVEPDTRVVVNGKAADSDGKTDRAPRLLALDPATIEAQREWRAVQASERIFFDSAITSEPIESSHGRTAATSTRTSFGNALTASLNAADFPHIRLHDMRHSYATAALKEGVTDVI